MRNAVALRGSRSASIFALAIGVSGAGCTCSKSSPQPAGNDAAVSTTGADSGVLAEPGGLSAPIAAAHLDGGDVIVVGLDVPARGIRAQRIRGSVEVVADRIVLDDVKWSSDADLKMGAAGKGVVVTWHGPRGGKNVRQMVVLGEDLVPRGKPVNVTAASCATRDTVWSSDGKAVRGITLADGAADSGDSIAKIPSEAEVSLVCGTHDGYAVLEGDETTSVVSLGVRGGQRPATLLRETDFGDDESRERAEYLFEDTLGIVRLAASGSLVTRELRDGKVTPLRTIATKLPQDDDIVAVDASSKIVAIAYTSDATESCKGVGHATKISALRVAREGTEEATHDLSPGTCGREVGPFFTSSFGDGVMFAWVERASTEKGKRPPIVGLGYARVPADQTDASPQHIEQAADALTDAGCDKTTCYAVALARREASDGMSPGFAKVLRYP